MFKKNTDARLGSIPLFKGLSDKELRTISSLMTELTIPAGTTLIKQDTVGQECMIILEGSAAVHRDGNKIASIGPGDIIGELSVISGLPRTATVTAETEMVIESLSRRELMSLLDDDPRIAKKILMKAITSLHELADNHVV